MKKRILMLLTSVVMAAALTACGGDKEPAEEVTVNMEEDADVTEEEETPEVEEIPEGFYRSELTNELISEDLKDQRPIAVMVDNDKRALPHYGLNQADVVYELMNSTANNEITRFMCLVKDWDQIGQFGSVRSTRPTNILLANEWNAIVCHDGGPFYIDDYLALPASNNISGYFGRVSNGKAREFTEYVMSGEVQKYADQLGISTTYTEYYEGPHYQFASETTPVLLEEAYAGKAKEATLVDLPFPNNQSELKYNAEDGLYYYSEYGSAHLDGKTNEQLAFKNVLLQRVTYSQLDENGYLIFNCIGEGQEGIYITNGQMINVTWKKTGDTDPTRYYDSEGNEITINTGKTYVGFVADQRWDELVIK